MFRVIQAGLSRPIDYNASPNDSFEPGMIAQLKLIGNDVVLGVSDGRAPLGIIDAIRTNAFSKAEIDEVLDVEVPVFWDGYNFITTINTIGELRNSNIVSDSFVCDIEGLILSPVNGNLHVPAGTVANYSTTGSAIPDAVRTTCRYNYRVPNLPGDDSTVGSGKMAIWFGRGIYQTDIFETAVPYALNATLFVSENGKFTTEQSSTDKPGVGMVIIPPSGHNSVLEFLWL